MKQINLKLNKYITSVIMLNTNIERLLLNIIFLFFGLLVFSYVFLLGNMINNIIERQSFEASARVLENEVRNLEVTYLSMSNDIDLDYSYSIGFKNTQATFATRKTLGFNSIDSIKTAPNGI